MLNIEAWTTPQSETGEKTVGHIFRKSIGKDMMDGVQTNIEGKPFEIHTISKHLRHAKPSITQDHYLKSSLQRVKEQF
jgi:integrase